MMEPWKRAAIKARNAAVLDVACPECRAAIGSPCTTWRDTPKRRPCFERIRISPGATRAVQESLAAYRATLTPTEASR